MLIGVIGNRFFHALLKPGSNHSGVSVGAALIWAIISFEITTILFLYQIAYLDQGRGINPRKLVSIGFRVKLI